MTEERQQLVLVDTYGGLCTLMDRSDLPVGLSPACSDVEFFPGGVRSRYGLASHVTHTAKTSGLSSWVDSQGVARRIYLTQDGVLRKEASGSSSSVLSMLDTSTASSQTLRLKTTTLGDRLYVCLSDGLHGHQNPLQYDGTTIWPVTQDGADIVTVAESPLTGNVSAGAHFVALVGETVSGYITPPLSVVTYNATRGGYKLRVTYIPAMPGPIARLRLFVSPANSSTLYTLDGFSFDNNLASVLSVDLNFTDAELIAGNWSDSEFYSLTALGPMLGVTSYHRRLVYWGGRNYRREFLDINITDTTKAARIGLHDLRFEARNAGLASTIGANWESVVSGATIATETGCSLACLKITGDGSTNPIGRIRQGWTTALARFNRGVGGFYMQPGRSYGLRVRARKGWSAATGGLTITVSVGQSVSSLSQVVRMQLQGSTLSQEWTVHEATGSAVSTYANYVGIDIWGGANTAIDSAQSLYIDWIEIYDLAAPDERSTLWISRADQPDSFDSISGFANVYEGNGQRVGCVFELRGNLYVAKERSLYVTQDNGGEPATWSWDEVSSVVGTPSAWGVGMGDGWAVIASMQGLYMFSGGAPEKISQEIQPTWDRINWTYGYKLWVQVDALNQRVYIGAPVDAGTECNILLVLDYVEGWESPLATGNGRKWTTFTGQFPCGAIAVMDDGSPELLMGSAVAVSGAPTSFPVLRFDTTARADATGTINPKYETAPIGAELGRSNYSRVLMKMSGSGPLITKYVKPDGTEVALASRTLGSAPNDDVDIQFHCQETQIGLKWETVGATDWWSLRRAGLLAGEAPYSRFRSKK